MGSEEFSPGSFVDFFFMMWKENGLGSCNVFFKVHLLSVYAMLAS